MELYQKQIIKPNEDCDAEYFFCKWFDVNSIQKYGISLPGSEICELMEEYHKQKSRSLHPTEIKFPEIELFAIAETFINKKALPEIIAMEAMNTVINWIKENNLEQQ